jgi:hypothetical protein
MVDELLRHFSKPNHLLVATIARWWMRLVDFLHRQSTAWQRWQRWETGFNRGSADEVACTHRKVCSASPPVSGADEEDPEGLVRTANPGSNTFRDTFW